MKNVWERNFFSRLNLNSKSLIGTKDVEKEFCELTIVYEN